MKKYISNSMFLLLLVLTQSLFAQTKVTIEDPATWSASELAKYQGQTITFTTPFYVCNNYNGLTISPRRTMSPTNQVLPGTADYREYLRLNETGEVYLNGVSGYHRMGERIENLTVKVSSTTALQAVGTPTFVGNTRAELEKGYPSVDMVGEHTLIVCALNLEYYLVANLGSGSMGPTSPSEQNKQHTKIMAALNRIRADIFGFVEIEQGQEALQKIANSLTESTGRHYSYIDDGGRPSGTYTKAGYVYCTETVEPYGSIRNNNAGVTNRKKMQAFIEKATGGKFIFSLNHFKAKGRDATGDNVDQGDGQGSYNETRVQEAKSVLTEIENNTAYFKDPDVLVMGDLNAYGKEDPITTLTDAGLIDMYRYFHADSAYSYVYRGQAGYLDHALANASMMQQVTGMQPYHINSDESDDYTYKSSDKTMFRCSDHDPVLVGLALGQTSDMSNMIFDNSKAYMSEGTLVIDMPVDSYYRVYDLMGNLITAGKMEHTYQTVNMPQISGLYMVQLYVKASETLLQVKTVKVRM